MAHAPRARSDGKPPRRDDGLTIAPAAGGRKAILLLAGAAALAAVALLTLFGPRAPEAPPAPPVEAPRTAPPVSTAAPQRAVVQEAPRQAQAPPTPPRDATPVDSTVAAGIQQIPPIAPSGIGVFPPPGTDPPKIGIIVPEGFELPEGYVRHYQATDDGQALPPILMFHPDYDWVDENGVHVEGSENGVVPPELAPPGMPIQMLELPETPSEP